MAVAELEIDDEVPLEQTLVEEIQEPRESLFTALVPPERAEVLLPMINGSPWTIWYYGQKLNGQTPINHFDVLKGDLSQAYTEIKNLVVYVQTPFSYDYDSNKGIQAIHGSSIMPPKMKPMKGDVFIANVESGEDVLFVVNNVERKTFLSNTLYEISYTSFAYTNEYPDYIDRLKSRVVESFHYDNRLDNGSKYVLLTDQEKNDTDALLGLVGITSEYYFSMFTHQSVRSLAIPGLNLLAYDYILTDWIYETCDFSKYSERGFHKYHVESIDYNRHTILDAIRNRTLPHKNLHERLVAYLHVGSFWRKAVLGTLQFTSIKYVSHPLNPKRNHLSQSLTVSSTETSLLINTAINSHGYDEIKLSVATPAGMVDKNVLHKLQDEDHYIVSKHFYEYLEGTGDANDISYIEYLIACFIRGEKMDKTSLRKAFETWGDWPTLHQFYLIPVMWYIIRCDMGVI